MMRGAKVSMILAADESELIGVGGRLPWHIAEDLRRFKDLTSGHVVVAGRKTQDSIVRRLGRPLPGRTTIVVTRRSIEDGEATICRGSIADALQAARERESEEIFIIGGAEIYLQVLPDATTIYLTRVRGTHPGDTYLPGGWLEGFTLIEREDHGWYAYETWLRI
jgi:dihydrofolate reductase